MSPIQKNLIKLDMMSNCMFLEFQSRIAAIFSHSEESIWSVVRQSDHSKILKNIVIYILFFKQSVYSSYVNLFEADWIKCKNTLRIRLLIWTTKMKYEDLKKRYWFVRPYLHFLVYLLANNRDTKFMFKFTLISPHWLYRDLHWLI